MKLPWIRRADYDRMAASNAEHFRLLTDETARANGADASRRELLGRNAVLTEELTELHAAYDALIDKHVALAERMAEKMMAPTITTVEPSHALPEAPRRELSVVDAVIRQEARYDRRLAAYFRSRAKVLREDHPHWTDQQVATELARWETAEAMAPAFLVGAAAITPNESPTGPSEPVT